jgi:hypothetical protein
MAGVLLWEPEVWLAGAQDLRLLQCLEQLKQLQALALRFMRLPLQQVGRPARLLPLAPVASWAALRPSAMPCAPLHL